MSWLTDSEIENTIRQFANKDTATAFHGIYPNDYLPYYSLNPPTFIIVNTDVHNLAGQHWKVIFIDENYCGEVFDSLATPLSNRVIRFMNRHTRKWKTNSQMFQHPTSTLCGAYVLYFVMRRLSFSSLQEFCKTFSSNVNRNEYMIQRFYDTLQ